MSDFNLIPDKRGFYLDVKYPHETKPRYFIDMIRRFCTCAGFMFTTHCKHMKKYQNKLHSLQLVYDETR